CHPFLSPIPPWSWCNPKLGTSTPSVTIRLFLSWRMLPLNIPYLEFCALQLSQLSRTSLKRIVICKTDGVSLAHSVFAGLTCKRQLVKTGHLQNESGQVPVRVSLVQKHP